MATGILSAVIMDDGTDVVSSSGYYNVNTAGTGDDIQAANNISTTVIPTFHVRNASSSCRASWARSGSPCGIWEFSTLSGTNFQFNASANNNFSVAFYFGVTGSGTWANDFTLVLPANVIANSFSFFGGSTIMSSDGSNLVQIENSVIPPSPLPTDKLIYVLVEYPSAISMSSIQIGDPGFAQPSNFFGLQMIQVSDTAQPPANCLGGETLIVVSEEGETKRLKDLGSSPHVLVKDKDDKGHIVKASLLRTKQVFHETAYTYKGITLSEAHILLENSCHGSLHTCSHCGSSGKEYGFFKPSCKRCSTVQVKDHFPISPRDCIKASDLFEEKDFVGIWYHIYLPEPFTNAAIALQTADGHRVLSEGFRHKLGTKKRDEIWFEV